MACAGAGWQLQTTAWAIRKYLGLTSSNNRAGCKTSAVGFASSSASLNNLYRAPCLWLRVSASVLGLREA